MFEKLILLAAVVCIVLSATIACGQADMCSPNIRFQLSSEQSLGRFGGTPFCVDLDADGDTDILWLQWSGFFSSHVFDTTVWKDRISEAEKELFCLTATDALGSILWQIGEPWQGKRPFISHGGERGLDWADIDGDGTLEIVCTRFDELLVIDARTGEIEQSVKTQTDNVRAVCIGRTGPGPADWTILAKNAEAAYSPHEYANPVWFYDRNLKLLKVADYLGAGHCPKVVDVDGDGLDEFVVGYNLIDNDLGTLWTFQAVPEEKWNAGEMHVDDIALGQVGGRLCVVLAASDTAFLLDARNGSLLWWRKGVHPQHCQIGRFGPKSSGNDVLIYNKRADLQLYDADGNQLWQMMPPQHFPLGQAVPCKRQKFHVFDPTTIVKGIGPTGTDLLIFTDGGWPYVIDGFGQRRLEFPCPPNAAQDWGEVPGRPDDYGYGYYARVADFDGDTKLEVLISDRRFAWLYEIEKTTTGTTPPRSDGRLLHADLENYVDGVVQPLNAGVRWLGHPFSKLKQGTVEITKNDAFFGSRAVHVQTEHPNEIGRVKLQRRFDAPQVTSDTVAEVVFRAVGNKPIDIEDPSVWEASSSAGKKVGLVLLSNGKASTGSYRLDILQANPSDASKPLRVNGVVKDLKQDE